MSAGQSLQSGDIICQEHQIKLDDPDLIDVIIEASHAMPCGMNPIDGREGFFALPREEQIALQLSWVEPMPRNTDIYEDVPAHAWSAFA